LMDIRQVSVLLIALISCCVAQYDNITFCDCSGNCGDGTNCETFPFNQCVLSRNLCDGTTQSEYLLLNNGSDPGEIAIEFFSDSGCTSGVSFPKDHSCSIEKDQCVNFPVEYPTYGFRAYMFCDGNGNNNNTDVECNATVAYYDDSDQCSGERECSITDQVTSGECNTVFLGNGLAYSYSIDCTAGTTQVYTQENCGGDPMTASSDDTCLDMGDFSIQVLLTTECVETSGDGDTASSLEPFLF
jgi:hypothetical protein